MTKIPQENLAQHRLQDVLSFVWEQRGALYSPNYGRAVLNAVKRIAALAPADATLEDVVGHLDELGKQLVSKRNMKKQTGIAVKSRCRRAIRDFLERQ